MYKNTNTKQKFNLYFFCLALSLCVAFSSCKKEQPDPQTGGDDEEEQTESISSVTVGSEGVTAFGAILKGKAESSTSLGNDAVMGIMWSEKSDFPSSMTTKLTADKPDRSYNYSVEAASLTPDTKYYYRSFLTAKGQEYLGGTEEFTTKGVSSMFGTLPASGIKAESAEMNATLSLTGIRYSAIEYGFYWGDSEESQDKFLKGGGLSEGKYSSALKDLLHRTQYWYKAWMKIDGKTFEGSLETFTTGTVEVESISIDKTELTFHNIGDEISLKATVNPSDATDKGIRWTTSDENVATVDDEGRVTAIGNGSAAITVTADENGKSASCSVTVSQWVKEITLDNESLALEAGDEFALTAAAGPDNAADKTLLWSSSDPSVATVDGDGLVKAVSKGGATITVSANDGSGVSACCEVTVYSYMVPGTVDLGLSVKWASLNVGASSPEEEGMYFAWGETETKETFTWSTYSLCYGTNNSITKYNVRPATGIVDGKTVLESEDDVASVRLGNEFRLPTREEIEELADSDNCTWTWTEMNGVNGYKVISKVEGFEGNWIFLPAAGYRTGGKTDKKGVLGYYWTSSVNVDQPKYSYRLGFGEHDIYWYNSERCLGLTVRPVTD